MPVSEGLVAPFLEYAGRQKEREFCRLLLIRIMARVGLVLFRRSVALYCNLHSSLHVACICHSGCHTFPVNTIRPDDFWILPCRHPMSGYFSSHLIDSVARVP